MSEHYDEALAEFKAAYDAKQMPRMLINIGQFYRKLGKPKEALDSYNAYLKAELNPEPQIRQKVDDYIHQAQAMMESATSGGDAQPPVMESKNNDRKKEHNNGVLLHWDGATWSARQSGVKKALTALWGSGPGDVWAGGENTKLLHYDGRAWNAAPNPLPSEYDLPTVASIWGTAANDVWAVSGVWNPPDVLLEERAILFHYDGTKWSNHPSSSPTYLKGVIGNGSKDVWAVGGTNYDACPGHDGTNCPALILHYNGKTWRSENGTNVRLEGVWSGGGEVWAVGKQGAVLKLRGK